MGQGWSHTRRAFSPWYPQPAAGADVSSLPGLDGLSLDLRDQEKAGGWRFAHHQGASSGQSLAGRWHSLLLRMRESRLPQQFQHQACKRKVLEVTFHRPPPPHPESPHLEEWDLGEGCLPSWGSG